VKMGVELGKNDKEVGLVFFGGLKESPVFCGAKRGEWEVENMGENGLGNLIVLLDN
jgi:hypothetical protein